jgi:hypothetical protein
VTWRKVDRSVAERRLGRIVEFDTYQRRKARRRLINVVRFGIVVLKHVREASSCPI